MLIVAVLGAVIVMALLVDNHRQGQRIRERYGLLITAMQKGDTNAIQGIVVGRISPSYLDAVVKAPWQTTNVAGPILVLGSSATFWPHGKGQRGFPIGDMVEWANSNGVWYVTSVSFD